MFENQFSPRRTAKDQENGKRSGTDGRMNEEIQLLDTKHRETQAEDPSA